ncbi:MAG TPA: hypothetical protein VGD99_02465, partial [Anaerolineae bacterium]
MTRNSSKHDERIQLQKTGVSNGHPTNGAPRDTAGPGRRAKNALNPLGEKIFLDRYALKDARKESVAAGDTVIVAVDLETGQREVGTVTALEGQSLTIELRDGTTVERALEHIDKPLETDPSHMLDRVARGIA